MKERNISRFFKVGSNRKLFFRVTLVYMILISSGSLSCISAQNTDVRFNMATYNIFYFTPQDHENSWEQRSSHVANVIRFHDIALLGSQEGLHNQLQDLRESLGYEYIGVARDDGDKSGEYSAIIYDPDRFEALDNGTFWLSPTPDIPSKDWGTNFRRICTWGYFRHVESDSRFYVYNGHFDHQSQEARENSSRMVLEHIDRHVPAGEPVVFMGDLNAEPGNDAYEMVSAHGRFTDSREISQSPPHGPPGTFNAFDIQQVPDRRIDHIFVTSHFNVIRYGVLTDTYLHDDEIRFPADHFPVLIEVILNKDGD
jgi:endonuclease/exonuclease/phosphatase family metal-dependent hydrolase